MKKKFSCVVDKIQDCPFRIPYKFKGVDSHGVPCTIEVYWCGFNTITKHINRECIGTFSDEPSADCPLEDTE